MELEFASCLDSELCGRENPVKSTTHLNSSRCAKTKIPEGEKALLQQKNTKGKASKPNFIKKGL